MLPSAWPHSPGWPAVDGHHSQPNITAVILFYDGVCGFCNWTVQFLLRHDHAARIRFAPLQSPLAASTLGADATKLDTVWAQTSDGRLLKRSRAIAAALRQLGGGWALLGQIARIFPTVFLDLLYRLFARYRYRLFGKLDACTVPSAADRARFLA